MVCFHPDCICCWPCFPGGLPRTMLLHALSRCRRWYYWCYQMDEQGTVRARQPPPLSIWVFFKLEHPEWEPRIRNGIRGTPSVYSRFSSKLPLPLYADVRTFRWLDRNARYENLNLHLSFFLFGWGSAGGTVAYALLEWHFIVLPKHTSDPGNFNGCAHTEQHCFEASPPSFYFLKIYIILRSIYIYISLLTHATMDTAYYCTGIARVRGVLHRCRNSDSCVRMAGKAKQRHMCFQWMWEQH